MTTPQLHGNPGLSDRLLESDRLPKIAARYIATYAMVEWDKKPTAATRAHYLGILDGIAETLSILIGWTPAKYGMDWQTVRRGSVGNPPPPYTPERKTWTANAVAALVAAWRAEP